MMSASVSRSGRDVPREDILTLAVAAAYLRTSESAVEKLVADDAIPARRIGGELRFLKKALDDWLRFPGRRDYGMHPHGMMDSPFMEDLVYLLEKRLLETLKKTAPQRGSKRAVLEHFGIFRDDDDQKERLSDARARREAGG
jgi:excisionase family DNA binding protein